VSKNNVFEKNHVPKRTKAAQRKNHSLEGKRGLSYSPQSNHVLMGKRVPSPHGHDCSLGEKKGLSCSPWQFKFLLPMDMIVL
jgi:hypothetical protein